MSTRILLALLLLLSPTVSQAWWNDDWAFRKEITLDASAAGIDGTIELVDVPVLVRLHVGNFGYFGDTQGDGSDIRFIAGDDRTPLSFHVERFDPVNQMAFLWVRVPRLVAGPEPQRIHLYYGNPEATFAADPAQTYDAQQVLVYHFSGSDGVIRDSTAYANDPVAMTDGMQPASLIGGGYRFAGQPPISVVGSPTLRLAPDSGLTVSAWLKLAGPQQDAYIATLGSDADSLALGVRDMRPYGLLRTGGATLEIPVSADLGVDTWHHVALRAGDGRIAVLVDGVAMGSIEAALPQIAGGFSVGGDLDGGNLLVDVELDELQVSTTARRDDWLRFAALSQGIDARAISYGADAQKEGGGDVSYFAITMRNVTVDGWVVIVILAVMFVISFIIMIGKALFLSRVRRDNAAFLAEYRKTADSWSLDREVSEDEEMAYQDSPMLAAIAPGEHGKYGASTLFRLYHVAVQEIHKRLGPSVGAAAVTTLSAQSIEAIKASLDATKARLAQMVGAQMVLLTIAISGGPFLGLLGTVVGVMITFAAIAASGDVNVNAIAPGIAAALAATVAGLAVAIPALFGYNWLNTQIKNIVTDNTVFIDELVAQVAERYS